MIASSLEGIVIPKDDVADGCFIEPGTQIEWSYKGQITEEKVDRRTGKIRRDRGIVVADYENYLVVRTPYGYNTTIDKVDVATGWIKVKGFKPKIKRVLASEYRC